MNSYIFNFKMGLIGKSLILFLILFVSYSIIIPRVFPNGGVPHNQWQGNIIKAQKYIYKNSNVPCVIVGSSLAAKMRTEFLSDKYYNLAFDGGSFFEGLEIIIRSNKVPKVVLVETNVITRKVDEKFISNLFTPVIYDLRSYIPSLRDEYQPITLAFPLFNLFLQKTVFRELVKEKQNQKSDKGVFDIWLSTQQKAHEKTPDIALVKNQLEELDVKLRILSNHGIKIVFFEMPTHPSLANSKAANFIRERLLQKFPPSSYTWIPMPDSNEYETTDGIHLDGKSAEKFATFLVDQTSNSIK